MGTRIILTIPSELYTKLERAAKQSGVTVQEYLRFLIMQEMAREGK